MLEFGIARYIPMTSTSEVAAAALRLIAAGGRYMPQTGTDLVNHRLAEMRDVPAITREGEARLTARERAVASLAMTGWASSTSFKQKFRYSSWPRH